MKTTIMRLGIGCLATLLATNLYAQSDPNKTPQSNPVNPGRIPESSFPGLLINPDLRSASMGDGGMGIRANGNASVLYLNPAKIVDQPYRSSVSLTYTPWLKAITDGQAVMYGSYYKRFNKNEGMGIQLTYFDQGNVQLRDGMGNSLGEQHVSDIYLSGSYTRRLSQNVSMAVSGQFIHSNAGTALGGYTSANAVNTSISLFRRAKDTTAATQLSYGVGIYNIGGKISYGGSRQTNFQPTNVRAGLAINRYLTSNGDHQLTATFDVMKMLVPTPPIWNVLGGVYQGSDPRTTSALGALFSSWSDAPGGFSEELKEIMWSLGAEYRYQNLLAARIGYFHESMMKGGRQNLTLGLGFNMKQRLGIDAAYLIPMHTGSPLANTWRLGLHFTFKQGAKVVSEDQDDDDTQ